MPRSSSSNGTTSYGPLSPAKRQRTFPSRRRSAHLKPALPKLSKKQSTLTQLDFATPSTKREIVDLSSDEEFEAPEPKRRKRTSKFDKRDADQSSMTQFERGEIPSLMKRSTSSALDDDDFTIWQHYSPRRWDTAMAESQRLRAPTLARLRESNEDLENAEREPEVPETSQAVLQCSPKVDSGVEMRPRYQTPRKVRFKTEVPSSQTPPSTKHSLQTTPRRGLAERSPLKERSGNAQVLLPVNSALEVEDSQAVTTVRCGAVQSDDRHDALDGVAASGERIRSTQGSVDGDPCHSAHQYLPPLRRTTTVQDSQSDNLSNLVTVDVLEHEHPLKLQRISTIPDSEQGDAEFTITQAPGCIERQPRKLQRTGTVQDSQWEDLESEADDWDDMKSIDGFAGGQESQYYGLQSTFDPANSALDRDAARFGWTQTQPRLDRIHERDLDSETDDEDLDRGCATPRRVDADIQPTDEQCQLVEAESLSSQSLQSPIAQEVTAVELAQQAEIADTAVADAHTHHLSAPALNSEVHIPSSPPALRPSQVSTVMLTQLSQPRPTSRQSEAPREPTKVEAFTFSSSPQQLYSIMPDTLSSSPWPLPPWTSPGSFRTGRGQSKAGREVAQLASLVDFSLPPPPPLNSSRRQTPASSST